MALRRNRITGVTPDAERNINQLTGDLEDRVKRLELSPGRAGVVTSDTSASPGEFLNIEAPPAGLTVILPEPVPSLLDARVTLCFRNKNPVRIVSIRGLVNRVAFAVNTAVGTFEAVCDGLDGWSVETGLGPAGSPTDARYVLGGAFAGLPNAAVGTDTAEIDFSFTPGTVATWALNVASVAFSKLANLTGLSVLGRAANSAGVMAAITATTLRQTLRVNDAGTALEWGNPVEWLDAGGIDLGDIYSARFNSGTRTTATVGFSGGKGTVQYDWTGLIVQVNDVDYLTSAITLDFDSSTSIIPVFLAAVGTEANIAFQRAALSGFVSAAQNVNTTQAAGFRVNGTLMPNPRGFVNMLSTTSCLAGGVDDGANDELELTFQRAALSGAISALQNSNQTLFSGILDNAAATTDRTSLNFVGFTITDDAANDRIVITAPDADNQVTIATTGNLDLTFADVPATCTRLTLSGAAPVLRSLEGGTNTGRKVRLYYSGSGTCVVLNSSATGASGNESRLFNVEDAPVYLYPRQGMELQANGTAGWRTYPYAFNHTHTAGDGVTANTLDMFDSTGDVTLSTTDTTGLIRLMAGSGSSGQVLMQSGGDIQANPTSVASTFRSTRGIAVAGASGYSPASGEMHLYANGSTSPSGLFMKDDLSQVWSVGYAASARATSVSSGALTTGGLTICSQSIVANDLLAGAVFEFFAHVTITRGATATATTPALKFMFNAVNLGGVSGVLQTAASGHTAWIEGRFTVMGAPAVNAQTFTSIWSANDIATAGTVVETSMLGAPASSLLPTNAACTLSLLLDASATVAGVTRSVNHAYIRRIA